MAQIFKRLFELSSTTTATAADIAVGKTAYNSNGELIVGTAQVSSNNTLQSDDNLN